MTRQEFFDEVNLARDFMGSTLTTDRQWDALQKRLGMLVLVEDVPEDVRYIAEGALMESHMRRSWLEACRPTPRSGREE